MSAKKNCDKKIYHLPGTSLEGGEGGGSKVTLAEALAAQSFYNLKNRSSIISSKSLSKNLSNENKKWCFCCLQDKT